MWIWFSKNHMILHAQNKFSKRIRVVCCANVIAFLFSAWAYLNDPLIVEQNSEHNVHGTHTTNTCKFMVPNTTNLAKQTMFRQIFKVVDSSNVFVHSSIYCNYLAGRAMPILKPNTCMRNHASSPRPKLRNWPTCSGNFPWDFKKKLKNPKFWLDADFGYTGVLF